MFLGTKKLLKQLLEVLWLVEDPKIIMGWDRIVFNLYIHQENIPNILMSIFQERSYLELMIFQLRCSEKILVKENFVRRCTINTKLSLMEEPHHGLDLLFFVWWCCPTCNLIALRTSLCQKLDSLRPLRAREKRLIWFNRTNRLAQRKWRKSKGNCSKWQSSFQKVVHHPKHGKRHR